jgi:hypothetical protein
MVSHSCFGWSAAVATWRMIARACSGKYMVALTTTMASMRSGCSVAI